MSITAAPLVVDGTLSIATGGILYLAGSLELDGSGRL